MMDDDSIRILVTQLSRPDGVGGAVIERAAIMAAGSDSAAIFEWIAAHDGHPEESVRAASVRGLHSARFSGSRGVGDTPPRRYVLPRGTLS